MAALQKQALNLNFGQGVNTKDDPWQIEPGQFLTLVNSVFTKGGMLQKRNGYAQLPTLPLPANNLTTFKENALAIGDEIQLLSPSTNSWIDKGSFTQAKVEAISVVRTTTSQTAQDVAVNNGLSCAVWLDSDGNNYYQVTDATTGNIIVGRVQLQSGSTLPRVFSLGTYFVITYLVTITAAVHLEYIAVPIGNPFVPTTPVSLSSQVKSLTAGYDGAIASDQLYLAFNASDLGGAIRITSLDSHLLQHGTSVTVGQTADLMSVSADISGSTPVIWLAYWDSSSSDGHVLAVNQILVPVLAPTLLFSNETITNITSVANAMVLTAFYEVQNFYADGTTRTDFINTNTCTQTGTVGTEVVMLRSVGLASKAFYFNDTIYMMVAYGEHVGITGGNFQPSYFLAAYGGPTAINGKIIARLAYSNGGGYTVNQVLTGVTINNDIVSIGYLFKDLLQAVNKNQNPTSAPPVYSQTGINLVNFTISNSKVGTAEVGGSLHLTGGLLWQFDGAKPVEHGFNVWPEDTEISFATSGGSLIDQTYFYLITYEWTDAAGNIHRSAPSIPYKVIVSGGSGAALITLLIPTQRLTYKVSPNKVRIGIYRWSTAQQNYYQITPYTGMPVNDPTVDYLTVTDGAADSTIIGNNLIYTTGGVLENIPMPSTKALTIFKSRLFAIDGEDQNLLWYSKPILENTPVEMTDLQTIYISPTISSQGSTGVNECIFPMDDKLILFKKDAIYYLTGNGPDATGANNDYGDPVFITSTVGCANPNSIVFMPNGLMFQSDKGIWLLGRDLATNYIGAPVEQFNSADVSSAFSVPGENQVRFTLNNGITLMYDYYYNQWGWFEGIPGVSSTIYQGLHTYINQYNQTFQENVGSYLDGSRPVTMSFTSAWFKMAGLQGFQRLYYFYLLGQYYSPHKLQLGLAYDYNPSPSQTVLITPVNFNGVYGSDPLYGDSSPYGGNSQVEQWRVFVERQKCQSFQITLQEMFDNSLGAEAGFGLTLSGLNLVVGVKKGWNTLNPNLSAG